MTDRAKPGIAVRDRRLAFEALADAELGGAYRLAGVILGNAWEAEDATHDAVVQAWLRFGSLREPDRFGAWFHRILVNTCRDRLRERSRRPTTAIGQGRGTVGDSTAAAEDRIVLDQAIEQLTPDHRVALTLRYHADLTVEQIADLLGIPQGTVKSRLHFAVDRMRAALTAKDGRET